MSIFLTLLAIAFLVSFSAICSGLNIALMALDVSDLKRKAKLGNKAARRMLPLRRNTHLTLAAILLTNVAAAASTPLVLDHALNQETSPALSGVAAGAISTLLLVMFGEILPQALFSRNALLWTSRFATLLRIMVIVTYPISKPLQILLDRLFPRNRAKLQSRHELGLLIAEHSDDTSSELDEDEVEIMRSTLQLSEKRVRDIMTDIRHTYWLTPDSELNGEKIDEIKRTGFSRIPIFNPRLTKTYGVLLIKDLLDIDFDEKLYRVDDIPLHATQLVGSMTALDTMFRKFIASHTHLIPIEKDDQIVGIVTIEDLIEEILGHEIEDETDRQKQWV